MASLGDRSAVWTKKNKKPFSRETAISCLLDNYPVDGAHFLLSACYVAFVYYSLGYLYNPDV